jgi:hypothetical protein
MTRVVRVIWGRGETIYFCGENWTGSIALIGLGKLGGRRTVIVRGNGPDVVEVVEEEPLLFQLGDELGPTHLDRVVASLGQCGKREGLDKPA